MKTKYLIIGAGPTGLGAGYRLKELGHTDYLIVDAASKVGGLAASFEDEQGFTWDIGGHVQFSHYSYFDELMKKALGPDGWLHHERESWVWMRDRFIPYPLQNNIRHLPKDEMWKALSGLVDISKNPSAGNPAHFKDWIHRVFGPGLAEIFMEPYNFKVWAYPPEQMSYEWIGERVAITDLKAVLNNIVFDKDELSWGPNRTFQFPKTGGTGAIWEGVANLVGREKIRLNAAATSINTGSLKTITLKDGSTIQYEHLLNTMPIDRFVGMIEQAPVTLKARARELKFSSSNIVGIGLQGKPPATLGKKCWMYFPEENCPFYRVTVFSNYSPKNVPNSDTHWSLMAEVSESPHRKVDSSRLIESVIDGLKATRLIDASSEVVSRWSYRAEYGYPTPSLHRNLILKEIHSFLEPLNVFSRGRFGGWKYEVSNQDHSLMQGVEWVNRIAHAIPETTYPFPAVANANWGK